METKQAPKRAKKPAAKAAEIKLVKFKNLRALKAAKNKRTIPRGLTVKTIGDEIVFEVKTQAEPVLKVNRDAFVSYCLRADGFRLG